MTRAEPNSEIKHERFNRLVEVINESSAEKNHAARGKTKMVLVDGIIEARGPAGTERMNSSW